MIGALTFAASSVVTAGIVKVADWQMVRNGQKHIYFWCRRWEVLTDADIPVDKFRSSERWTLAAVDADGRVLALFPGCQVKGWIALTTPPAAGECFVFGASEVG